MIIMTAEKCKAVYRMSMIEAYLCYKTKNFTTVTTESVITKLATKLTKNLNAIRTDCKNSTDVTDILVFNEAESDGDFEGMMRA